MRRSRGGGRVWKESTALLCPSVQKDKHDDGGSPEVLDKSISTIARGLVHVVRLNLLQGLVCPRSVKLKQKHLAIRRPRPSTPAFNSSAASASGNISFGSSSGKVQIGTTGTLGLLSNKLSLTIAMEERKLAQLKLTLNRQFHRDSCFLA